jgi:plastocyanin
VKRVALLFAFMALLTLPAIAVAATSAPASESPTAMNQMGAGVTIVDFAFQPAFVAVSAGSTVSWFNAGGAPHTVTSDTGAFDSGTLGPGGSFSVTFSTPGTYTYHCAIHPSMVGTVQVS